MPPLELVESRNPPVATARFLCRGFVLYLTPGRSTLTGLRNRSLAVAALIFSLLLTGCGVVGEPLPPLLEIPAAVQDLAATQTGNRLRLTWSAPRLTTEGTRVREIYHVEVYGAFFSPASTPPEFASQAQLLATIVIAEPADSAPPTASYEVELKSAQLGQKAFFAIKAINRRGKDAGPSNISSVEIAALPGPPANLEAAVTEKAIELRWKPSSVSVFGGPAPEATGYQIYRADVQTPQPAEQIGSSEEPTFKDTSFEFGHRYTYSAVAFVRAGDSTAVTPPSASLEVAASDVFPPAAPANVRAIAVPGAMELAWSPNSEADLAGYNVYRGSGESFAKRNAQLLPIPTFRDEPVTVGARYIYRVRAVDKNGNESVPSEDTAVTAE